MVLAFGVMLDQFSHTYEKSDNMAVCLPDGRHSFSSKVCELLTNGSLALVDGRGVQAVRYYEKALEQIKEDATLCLHCLEQDITVLCYAYAVALVDVSLYDELQQAVTVLADIIGNDRNPFPIAYFGIGKAYIKLNRFKDALSFLKRGLDVAERCQENDWSIQKWPGTDMVIEETCREKFVSAVTALLDICICPPPPDAICLFDKCSLLKEIRYSDPDFKGFIELHCSHKCILVYHPSCYSALIKDSGTSATEESLGSSCMTPDCDGIIICVRVFNLNGLLEQEWEASASLSKPINKSESEEISNCDLFKWGDDKQKLKKDILKEVTLGSQLIDKSNSNVNNGETNSLLVSSPDNDYSDLNIQELWNISGQETIVNVSENYLEENALVGSQSNDLDKEDVDVCTPSQIVKSQLDPETPVFIPKQFANFECSDANNKITDMVTMANPTGEAEKSDINIGLQADEPIGFKNNEIPNEGSYLHGSLSPSETSSSITVYSMNDSEKITNLLKKEVFISMEKFLSFTGPLKETDSKLLDMVSMLSIGAQHLIAKVGGLVKLLLQSPKFAKVGNFISLTSDIQVVKQTNTHGAEKISEDANIQSSECSSFQHQSKDIGKQVLSENISNWNDQSNLPITDESLNTTENAAVPNALSGATKEQLDVLRKDVHVFMEKFLSIVGPLEQRDERLAQMEKTFSHEARNLMTSEGGFIPFLLQDPKILLVHKYLCYNSDIKKALAMYTKSPPVGCSTNTKGTDEFANGKGGFSTYKPDYNLIRGDVNSENPFRNVTVEVTSTKLSDELAGSSSEKTESLKKALYTVIEKFLRMTGPVKETDKRLMDVIQLLDDGSKQLIANNGGLASFLKKDPKILKVHEYFCYNTDIGKAIEMHSNSKSSSEILAAQDNINGAMQGIKKESEDQREVTTTKTGDLKESLIDTSSVNSLGSSSQGKIDEHIDFLKKTVYITMERFLNMTGPLEETSEHLLNMISMFSNETQELIAREGGFIPFLLSDPKIQKVHDYICYNMDVQKAQSLHSKASRRKNSTSTKKDVQSCLESVAREILPTGGLNPNAADFNPIAKQSQDNGRLPEIMEKVKDTSLDSLRCFVPQESSEILCPSTGAKVKNSDVLNDRANLYNIEIYGSSSSSLNKTSSQTLSPRAKQFYPSLLNTSEFPSEVKTTGIENAKLMPLGQVTQPNSSRPSLTSASRSIDDSVSQSYLIANATGNSKGETSMVNTISRTLPVPSILRPAGTDRETGMAVVGQYSPFLAPPAIYQGNTVQVPVVTGQSIMMPVSTDQTLTLQKIIATLTQAQHGMHNEILALRSKIMGLENINQAYVHRLQYQQEQAQQDRQKLEIEKQGLARNLGTLQEKLDLAEQENLKLQAHIQMLSTNLDEKEKQETTNKTLVSTLWRSFEEGSERAKNTELKLLHFQKSQTTERFDHLIDFASKLSERLYMAASEWVGTTSMHSHLKEYQTKCLQHISSLQQAKEMFIESINDQIECVKSGRPLSALQAISSPSFATVTNETLSLYDGLLSALHVPNSAVRSPTVYVSKPTVVTGSNIPKNSLQFSTFYPSYSSVVKELNTKTVPTTSNNLLSGRNSFSHKSPPNVSGQNIGASFSSLSPPDTKRMVQIPPGFQDQLSTSVAELGSAAVSSGQSDCLPGSRGGICSDVDGFMTSSSYPDLNPCTSMIYTSPKSSPGASISSVNQMESRTRASSFQGHAQESPKGSACNDVVLNNPNNVIRLKKKFKKLRESMQLYFPHLDEEELQRCIVKVHAINKCSLSGMTYPQIAKQIEQVLMNKDSCLEETNETLKT